MSQRELLKGLGRVQQNMAQRVVLGRAEQIDCESHATATFYFVTSIQIQTL